jgi:outer membrane PBP1 activator LpoA protein
VAVLSVKFIWVNRRILAGLFAIGWTAVLLIGCGKKGPDTKTVQPQEAQADAGDASQPRPPTYDEEVTQRSIDFLKTRVGRKDWAMARKALEQLAKRTLTPQQQQEVDSLKAQVPPG